MHSCTIELAESPEHLPTSLDICFSCCLGSKMRRGQALLARRACLPVEEEGTCCMTYHDCDLLPGHEHLTCSAMSILSCRIDAGCSQPHVHMHTACMDAHSSTSDLRRVAEHRIIWGSMGSLYLRRISGASLHYDGGAMPSGSQSFLDTSRLQQKVRSGNSLHAWILHIIRTWLS